MFNIWVGFHVLTCVALILVVLMQSAKGEGLAGSAFGGGGGGMGGAVFGGRGAASFLSNATTILAIVFMVNCIALAFMSSSVRQGSDFAESGESAVTRQARQEYDQAQQTQQQRVADSLAAAGGGDTTVSLENLIPLSDQSQETTPPTDSN